jgi:hypothetical protein
MPVLNVCKPISGSLHWSAFPISAELICRSIWPCAIFCALADRSAAESKALDFCARRSDSTLRWIWPGGLCVTRFKPEAPNFGNGGC